MMIRDMEEATPLRLVGGKPASRAGEPTDDELMLLVKANHQTAFEVLVRRHQTLVLGLATRFVGDAAAGKDIAQDVFLALWSERHRYESRGLFRSYLVSCTIHRCQIVVRKERSHERKHHALSVSVGHGAGAVPGNEALHALVEMEQCKNVREKLTLLPEKMREVLILRFTSDLSIQEICEATGLREGTVKSHLFRGVARLHRLFGKDRT
jgi:RNA polymerase sigma factor (sigma-70 family)